MSDARQFDLFSGGRLPPYNRRRNVDTSKAGARKIAPQAAAMRARILNLIRQASNGMTSDEICIATDKGQQTVSGRLWELRVEDRAIEDSGRRREGRSGVQLRVYIVRKRRSWE
jgi:hypothetical protein